MMLLRKLAAQVLGAKSEEFAPGIPKGRERQSLPVVKDPQTWEFVAQRHEAARAGTHLDLRLVDPSGKAHSWAVPRAKLPGPGEKVLAIPQATHTREYAAQKGTFDIREGYGKGRVIAPGLRPVEVVQAGSGGMRFNLYGGGKEGNQEFVLRPTSRGHLLQNVTATTKGITGVPGSKKVL